MEGKGVKIGICDDCVSAVSELHKLIRICLTRNGHTAEIVTFLTGNELVLLASELDIVFLDIDMLEMDGIKAGKILHRKNENCKIVMATGREERFKDAFKINAFRFVSKPFDIREIEDALKSVWQTFVGLDKVELYENRESHLIEQKCLVYLYAYDSNVEVAVGNGKMRTELSLSQLEAVLDKRLFFRISRKYIVNMKYISKYQDGVIHIQNEELRVARARKKEFEKAYREFDVKYRG